MSVLFTVLKIYWWSVPVKDWKLKIDQHFAKLQLLVGDDRIIVIVGHHLIRSSSKMTFKSDMLHCMYIFSHFVDDPVRMFEYQTQSPNSVIKFLSDLYSCQRTANLLYTNDAKVLIDIIVRQLNDLSPGDQVPCVVFYSSIQLYTYSCKCVSLNLLAYLLTFVTYYILVMYFMQHSIELHLCWWMSDSQVRVLRVVNENITKNT